MAALCACPYWWQEQAFADSLFHAQKAGLAVQKVHKLSIQHYSRESKREAVNTWPDFAGTESYEIPRIREQEV